MVCFHYLVGHRGLGTEEGARSTPEELVTKPAMLAPVPYCHTAAVHSEVWGGVGDWQGETLYLPVLLTLGGFKYTAVQNQRLGSKREI